MSLVFSIAITLSLSIWCNTSKCARYGHDLQFTHEHSHRKDRCKMENLLSATHMMASNWNQAAPAAQHVFKKKKKIDVFWGLYRFKWSQIDIDLNN